MSQPPHAVPSPAASPAPPAAGEQRGAPRVGADFAVALHVAGLPAPLPARARDLGVGGMAVATRAPFALSELRRAVLALPDGTLALEAEGRWQHPVRGEDGVLTGLRFTSPSRADVERLWDAVQTGGRALAHLLVGDSDLAALGVEGALALAQSTRRRSVRRGQWLYRQGLPAPGDDSLFVVERGEVALQTRVRDAREVTLARLGPGRLFGGLALLAPGDLPESAVATCDTQLLEIDRAAFEALGASRPWLAWQLGARILAAHAERARALLARAAEGA